jgi:hypothetical protein
VEITHLNFVAQHLVTSRQRIYEMKLKNWLLQLKLTRIKEAFAKIINKIMDLIKNKAQLKKNMVTLETYLDEGNESEKEMALLLIKRGICFVAYKVGDATHFAPSRFVGYVNNTLEQHEDSWIKDGTETNKAIFEILTAKPSANEKLQQAYFNYCRLLGFEPNKKGAFGVSHKFWDLTRRVEFCL